MAIKVLPSALASDPDRLARFQREAQVLASLNHPNIAIIHGLEDSGDTPALVLELVEGSTLADRIAAGPLPIEEAIRVARQIAAALEAAHQHGIVHRDLKPANIKITPAGVVKVLDFGLAKLVEGPATDPAKAGHYVRPDLTASPTITSPALMTGVGIVLGTAAYMAPEQARGQTVDKRADIWAFGCVLYEMLTGRSPFDGRDVTDTLASVLKVDPVWRALPPHTPPALRRLLRRTLQKDPDQRLHDIADARLDLEEPLGEPEAMVSAAARVTRRRGIAGAVAAAVVAAVVSAGSVWWLSRPAPPPVRRLAATIDAAAPLGATNDPAIVISPDGSKLIYVTGAQGGAGALTSLMLRPLNQLEAGPIPGTESAHSPFFSPDGQWIGFFGDGDRALKKVPLAGGPAVVIAKVPSNHLGASWGSDGTIVFAGNGLSRVSDGGGTPEVLTNPDPKQNETRHMFPDVLPHSRGVLFTANLNNLYRVEVLIFETGERRVVAEGGTLGRYVPTGHVVYSQGGRLFAVPFDQDEMRVTGEPAPVLEGVSVTSDGPAQFSVSREGSLIYVPGSASGGLDRTLVWVGLDGREEPIASQPRRYWAVRLSPEGNRVAMEIEDQGNYDIWVHDLARGTQTRLTFDLVSDRTPLWTPDGRRVLFTSGSDLVWKAADGTGDIERLAAGLDFSMPWGWTPDGKTLLFTVGGPPDIYRLVVGAGAKPEPLLQSEFALFRPALSPDGRWLAYGSNESGRNEVYVRPYPNVNAMRWQISTGGGDTPFWSPDGRRLFYRQLGGITAVLTLPVTTSGETLVPGTPRLLFQARADQQYVVLAGSRSWDIAPDGRRLLMIKPEGAADGLARQVIVVENWTEELKRLVPTR